jgi:hypothetical protein
MNSTTTVLCKLGFNKVVESFTKYGYSLYEGSGKTTWVKLKEVVNKN